MDIEKGEDFAFEKTLTGRRLSLVRRLLFVGVAVL